MGGLPGICRAHIHCGDSVLGSDGMIGAKVGPYLVG